MRGQEIVAAGAYAMDEQTKIRAYELYNGTSGSDDLGAEVDNVSALQVKATLGNALALLAQRVAHLEVVLVGKQAEEEVCVEVLALCSHADGAGCSIPGCPVYRRIMRLAMLWKTRRPTRTTTNTVAAVTQRRTKRICERN